MLSLLLALSAQATDIIADRAFEGDPGPDANAPIINGEKAKKDDYPMTGGMLVGGTVDLMGFEIEGKLLMCSSTLIAPDVVLLAAHCVDLESMLAAGGMAGVTLTDVQFGWSRKSDLTEYQMTPEAMMNPPDWPSDFVPAFEVLAHPDFNIMGMGLGLAENDDIALMFLEEPVLDVPFAYVITKDEDEQLDVDVPVDIVGWGQQTGDAQPPPGTVGIKMQAESYIAEVADYEFQVGLLEEDARKCHGDSGGPSFMRVTTESSEDLRIVGVTSHAYDMSDCTETGGVDTRVGHYLKWIDKEMTKRCEDGTRVWCDYPGLIPPPTADGVVAWAEEETTPLTTEEDEGKGCGCTSAPASASWWIALPLLALARRRTRALA